VEGISREIIAAPMLARRHSPRRFQTMVILLDTNVLLHYDFERPDWGPIVETHVQRVLPCWVNLHELDRLKDGHPNLRRRDRARRVLRLIEEVNRSEVGRLVGGMRLAFCKLHPVLESSAAELDATNPDHRLVATALRFREIEGCEVELVTHDTTPRICRRAPGHPGVRYSGRAQASRIGGSPDATDPPARTGAGERSRRPKISVGFEGLRTIELAWRTQPIVLDAELADAFVGLVQDRYPLPSSKYQDFDPAVIPDEITREDRGRRS
jgi:hypothetical protein